MGGKKIRRKTHDVCVHGLVRSIDFLSDCYRRLLFCYVSIGWVQVCLLNREPFYQLSYNVQNSNCCRPISIWNLFQSFFSRNSNEKSAPTTYCLHSFSFGVNFYRCWCWTENGKSLNSFLSPFFLLLLTFLLKHFRKQFTMPTANNKTNLVPSLRLSSVAS